MSGHALRIEGLSAGYHGRAVLEDLSLPPIEAGEMVTLVGPNAAGKTTLLRALAGLVRAHGRLWLGDRDLMRASMLERAGAITYMPQALPDRVTLTVLEGVIGALKAAPLPDGPIRLPEARRRAVDTLVRLGIDHLALRPLDELSGGQRQLASLAQAIVRAPAVLLLDEPTSALDLKHQIRVMTLIRELTRERGLIAIAVLHDVSLATRWADRLAVLSEGRIAAFGRPDEALTAQLLRETYGVLGRIEKDFGGGMSIAIDGVVDDQSPDL